VLLKVLVATVILGVSLPASASFAVLFNGVLNTLPTGGTILSQPGGVVADFYGNVYIADTANGRLVKQAADGTTSVLAISGLSTALSSPRELALDSAGNLYIADTANSRIVKVDSAGSGSVVNTGALTLASPKGVAIDPSGNIFISDSGNSRIVEVTTGGTASVFTITGLGTPLASQSAIAIDPYGNVFVADTGNDRVVKISKTGVGAALSLALSAPLTGPSGVAVGNNGVLYIADTSTTPSGHATPGRVVIVDSQGNARELLNATPVFNSPTGIAVSSTGILYLADSGSNVVDSIQVNSVNFGRTPLGVAGASIVLPFAVSGSVTLTSVSATTSGAPNLDFTIGSGSTCAASTTNTSCTVDVTFTPSAPGLRKGAVVLAFTIGGTPGSFTVPIAGVADASVATVSPAVASVFNIGSATLSSPFQTAIDGAYNIYVASYSGNKVTRVPAGGGSGTTVNTGSYTLSLPTGVALDGAGNLFIADYGNSRIVEVAADGTASLFTISGLSQAISQPTALAFDGAGNLYIADYGRSRIVEVSPSGQGTVLAVGSFTFTSASVTGMAVDAIGNVYIADRSAPKIVKVDPLGKATQITPASVGALSGPQGVAVDGSGNLYIMDSGNRRIIQITTSGTTSVMAFAGATLGSLIFGITSGPVGNILIADWSNNRLVKIDVSQSALTFASTPAGVTSSDSPKTVTVTNNGVLDLTFPVLGSGNNPAISSGFSAGNASTCPQLTQASSSPGTLPAGNQCTLALSFMPPSGGAISGTLVLTDNSLNTTASAYATQTVSLSGVATKGTPPVTWSTPADIVYGTPLDSTQLDATSTVAGTFSYSPDVGTILTVGTHTLSATFTPTDAASYLSAQTTTTISVTPGTAAVTVAASPASPIPGQPVSYTATVTASYGTPTGTIQFLTGSTVLGSAALDANGIATFTTTAPPADDGAVTAQYSGDTNYLAATGSLARVEASFSLTASASDLTIHAGETAQVTLTFTPVGGFTGTITLSCSGVPASRPCDFSPQTLVADGSDSVLTSQLTFSKQSATAVGAGMTLVGLLLLPGMAISSKRRGSERCVRKALACRTLVLAGVVAALSALSGCSGDHSRFQAGAYAVTVTAVASQTANGYQGPATQVLSLTLNFVP